MDLKQINILVKMGNDKWIASVEWLIQCHQLNGILHKAQTEHMKIEEQMCETGLVKQWVQEAAESLTQG